MCGCRKNKSNNSNNQVSANTAIKTVNREAATLEMLSLKKVTVKCDGRRITGSSSGRLYAVPKTRVTFVDESDIVDDGCFIPIE